MTLLLFFYVLFVIVPIILDKIPSVSLLYVEGVIRFLTYVGRCTPGITQSTEIRLLFGFLLPQRKYMITIIIASQASIVISGIDIG
mmetsp:Transcript_21790/g.28099  ORF Transcript_21790/g.28099 Transcript_21790/m.28099 type:complete len:86 (+) Transcript_21790:1546-1803(+)